MNYRFFPVVASMPALASALLFNTGCLTGIKVGDDGSGGSATTATSTASTGTSTTASSGGLPVATGMNCKSPAALLCNWGQPGGPCGGSRPNKKDCDPDFVCVGATADTEGTCMVASATFGAAGDACGSGPGPLGNVVCAWNYVCDAPITPNGSGHCVPRTCILDDVPLTSEASFVLNGDGPTQEFGFGSSLRYGITMTGEASGYVIIPDSVNPTAEIEIIGINNPVGDDLQGNVMIGVQLTGVGTTHLGGISYQPAGSTSNYFNSPVGGDEATFTITEITADRIRGSYDALTQSAFDGATKHLSGTFDVCRLPDSTQR